LGCGLIGLFWFIIKTIITAHPFYLNVTDPKIPYISFGYIILMFFSLFFILEFIEHKRHRTSLLKDLLHGYLNPLLAIIGSSILLGLYMELQNVPIGLWRYINWPWQNTTISSVPVLVIAIGWPLHYIFFLSLYRAIGDER